MYTFTNSVNAPIRFQSAAIFRSVAEPNLGLYATERERESARSSGVSTDGSAMVVLNASTTWLSRPFLSGGSS